MAENTNGNQGDGSETPTRDFGEVVEREEDAVDETEVEDESQDETETEEAEETEETEEAESEDGETEGDEEVKKTEKGTKLDPNPESAAHQLLANAKRDIEQRDKVLADPALLAKFIENQYGVKVDINKKDEPTETKTEVAEVKVPEFKEYKAEDLENLDDVAGVINGMQKNFVEQTKSLVDQIKTRDAEIKQLSTAVNEILQNGRDQQIASSLEQARNSLQQEPELNPKDPDFVEGLEEDIVAEFNRLDFDEKTGRYRGEHSLKEVGDRIISVARKATKKGSAKAQTIVKTKTPGKIKTSPKAGGEGKGSENMDPSSSIAAGISKLF